MLVGRERELNRLRAALEEGSRTGVIGEAGVGKTTVVRAAAAAAGRKVFEAGALATLQAIPLLPITRAVGRPLPTGDDAHVVEVVREHVGTGVLFMDDLQWTDAQTLALLPLLVERSSVVVALRNGEDAEKARAEADALGFELLELEPLSEPETASLVRHLRPDLAGSIARRIARQSGGNPFFAQELALTGEATPSLRLAVRARLHGLSENALDGIRLLALAGGELPVKTFGERIRPLVESGAARRDGDAFVLRHALIGEVAVADLDEGHRRRLHRVLAERAHDAGTAAVHFAAAGEPASAYAAAMEATARAERPGEVAQFLTLAAESASGAVAESTRIRAAALLSASGEYRSARDLLDLVAPRSSQARATVHLIRAQIRAAEEQVSAARDEIAAGLALVGAGTEVEARLRVQEVAMDLDSADVAPAEALAKAESALTLALDRGADIARAHLLVGRARSRADRPDWQPAFVAAIEEARRQDDAATEFAAADSLVYALLGHGFVERGRRITFEMIERARADRLKRWERRFRCRKLGFDFHGGHFGTAVEEGRDLLSEPLETWERVLAQYYLAQASIDRGFYDDARRLSADLRSSVSARHEDERLALWVLTEAEFWSGRPDAAVATVEELLATFPHQMSTFVRITRAWALFESGRSPEPPDIAPQRSLLAGAVPELQAVATLADSSPLRAAGLFDEAAAKWRARHMRGYLRCRWAAGEAVRLAGDNREAVARLEAAEREITAHGHVPLSDRVHRSLRLAGVRRAAPRTGGRGSLTGREREVLELVAHGLTTAEIARRLALNPSSVERLIRTAAAKLGARTRAQAATLAKDA